jgi:hypothetical protein
LTRPAAARPIVAFVQHPKFNQNFQKFRLFWLQIIFLPIL